MNRKIILSAGLALLTSLSAIAPSATWAVPTTYQIGKGSAAGFSGSWLHSGTDQMGNSGFYANGTAMRIAGYLTLDKDTGSASGEMSGSGDFGLGVGDWMISITGGSTSTQTFRGGETDLLTVNYDLSSNDALHSSGSFYFADRDFNGGTREDGPNHIGDVLYLWGNNWVNENEEHVTNGETDHGTYDRYKFIDDGGYALGMDLYGVPEPGLLALMAGGLMGIGFSQRLRRKR